jgi:hypothetical protein
VRFSRRISKIRVSLETEGKKRWRTWVAALSASPELITRLAGKLAGEDTENKIHHEKGANDDEGHKEEPIEVWLSVARVYLGKGKTTDCNKRVKGTC